MRRVNLAVRQTSDRAAICLRDSMSGLQEPRRPAIRPHPGKIMSDEQDHRGIRYRVHALNRGPARRWKWEVEPPVAVRGLKAQSGELEGNRDDAVRAAKLAIDAQTGHFER
jgi:hypothetical protein